MVILKREKLKVIFLPFQPIYCRIKYKDSNIFDFGPELAEIRQLFMLFRS